MSRSFKKTAISGYCAHGAGQMKEFKVSEHRRQRRCVAQVMHNEDFDNMPDEKEFGDENNSPQDGKFYHGGEDYNDRPDLLRK